MTNFVAMPGSLGPWQGGRFSGGSCVLAGNPGPMTLDGTNTWVLEVDEDSVVLVDPGPHDREHLTAVEQELAGRRVREILLSHGHADHSEGAGLFSDQFAAPVRALDPVHRLGDEGLTAGEVLVYADLEVHIVGTPGHTSDSVSMHIPQRGALLTGDTILGRGTTVVAHPDGRLGDYLASLRELSDLVQSAGATQVWPGHGPVLPDAAAALAAYLDHRNARLEEVAGVLESADPDAGIHATAQHIVEHVYADVPRVLWPAALLSVRAQLEYLGRV